MKKLLFCLTIIVLTTLASCTKETTYSFTDYTDYSGLSIRERIFWLKEYDINGSCVSNNRLESPVRGKAYVFTANERSELIKIYISVKFQNGSPLYSWVQQVYYLKEGGNVDISIDGNTLVGPSEP
ncbi:MAG: hypothetical protein II887_00415 [Bacteroidales bacterium]|nr:hypothetical protein [Bacteroidales bacterium]